MRIAILLTMTILCATTGFFIGGYAFNATHPIQSIPHTPLSQTAGLQAVHRQAAVAAEHHVARHNWLYSGAILGAGVGFFGTLLFRKSGIRRK